VVAWEEWRSTGSEFNNMAGWARVGQLCEPGSNSSDSSGKPKSRGSSRGGAKRSPSRGRSAPAPAEAHHDKLQDDTGSASTAAVLDARTYLSRLRIRDFALVQEQDVEFQPGLNCVTGESGSGKSVLVWCGARVWGGAAVTDTQSSQLCRCMPDTAAARRLRPGGLDPSGAAFPGNYAVAWGHHTKLNSVAACMSVGKRELHSTRVPCGWQQVS
jgi:hypothetical protein